MDYTTFNHSFDSGEMLRIDFGCDYNHYKGDFGRTIPVSGQYSEGQKEVWNLLIAGYLAGLKTIKDGVPKQRVFDSFNNEVSSFRGRMRTELGEKALDLLLAGDAHFNSGCTIKDWVVTKDLPDTCKAGMVLAWEVAFAVDDSGFYLEDMVLVTEDGHEMLTPGVPHWAEDLERILAK